MYYEAKARYYRTADDGAVKTINENYVVEASNFAEAEMRTLEHIAALTDIDIDLKVTALKQSNIGNIIDESGEADGKFYRCKVNVLMVDDVTLRECAVPACHLVYGCSIDDAGEQLKKYLDKKESEYDILSVQETNIVDIIFDKTSKEEDIFLDGL